MVMTLLTLPRIRNMNLCCNNKPSRQNEFKYKRLHIPKRGRWESEEIVGCINESRKVMFIMSESFLERGWHSYAVQMAITHAFHNQRQGSIVVIIKDGLPLDRLPNEIKNIWWCIEHFRWPEDDNSDEYILSKLSSILRPD
uniref:TIR domain-containing protein n=1 Tax=Magallana gigas TaxID=29159 RepID=A0A8W8JAA1_MAGGI